MNRDSKMNHFLEGRYQRMNTQPAHEPTPITVSQDLHLPEATRFMLDNQSDMVKVTNEHGNIVGMITRNIILLEVAKGLSGDLRVKDVMTQDPEYMDWADDLEHFAADLEAGAPDLPAQGWKDRVLQYFYQRTKTERKAWRGYIDGISNPVIGVDRYGRINVFNKAAEKITGIIAKQAYGKDVSEIFDNSEIKYVLQSGEKHHLRKIHTVGKNFLSSRSPVVVDRNIVGAVSILQETSDLEKVVQELEYTRQLNQQLDAIIESSFDGLYICDGKANTLRINKSFERIMGVTSSEVVGRNMADLVSEGVFSRSGTLLALQRRERVTIPLQSRNGKTALVTSTPIFDDQSNIVLVVTNVRDMTELKDLERRLEHSEDRRQRELSAVFESSFDGLYISDGEGNTLRINKAFERILGVTSAQVVGRNMADLVREGVFSRSGTLLALQRRERVTIPLEANTGKTALVTSTPIFDDQGNIVLVVTNVRDMTELNELHVKVEHLEGLSRFYQNELTHLRLQNRKKCIAHSRKMRDLLQMITHVASVDSTVLIQGESGSGKEVIADVLHSYSGRKDNPFIKVNCGAIPANLLESELFGYEPGAFSGASKTGKAGMFELAQEGSIFLDEIGEMPLDLQVKLLRVLQDKQIFRVGGNRPINVNVRILAGTNRNLQQMVANQQFRQDLFYRLNVIPVFVPPLRERREDIPVLSQYFLDYYNRKHQMGKRLSSDALKPMLLYDWPGNIRELENLIERLVVTTLHDTITSDDVHACLELASFQGEVDVELMPLPLAIENTERRLLQKAFSVYNSTYKVAGALGISQPSVVRKAAKYGIKENGAGK